MNETEMRRKNFSRKQEKNMGRAESSRRYIRDTARHMPVCTGRTEKKKEAREALEYVWYWQSCFLPPLLLWKTKRLRSPG